MENETFESDEKLEKIERYDIKVNIAGQHSETPYIRRVYRGTRKRERAQYRNVYVYMHGRMWQQL